MVTITFVLSRLDAMEGEDINVVAYTMADERRVLLQLAFDYFNLEDDQAEGMKLDDIKTYITEMECDMGPRVVAAFMGEPERYEGLE